MRQLTTYDVRTYKQLTDLIELTATGAEHGITVLTNMECIHPDEFAQCRRRSVSNCSLSERDLVRDRDTEVDERQLAEQIRTSGFEPALNLTGASIVEHRVARRPSLVPTAHLLLLLLGPLRVL